MHYKILKNKFNLYLTHVLEALVTRTGRKCTIVDSVDEADDAENEIVYILSFFHYTTVYPKKYIVFQVEQMHCATFTKKKAYLTAIRHAIQCWDYNQKNQPFYRSKCPIWMPVPVACDVVGLVEDALPLPLPLPPSDDADTDSIIDVLFYGAPNERRLNIMRYLSVTLEHHRIRVKYVTNVYNQPLYALIRRSKIVLNLGFYPDTLLATYRLNEILQHHRAIISETTEHVQDKDIISQYKQSGIYFIPYIHDNLDNIHYLVQGIHSILNESETLCRQRTEKSIHFMKEKENFFLHHMHHTLAQLE